MGENSHPLKAHVVAVCISNCCLFSLVFRVSRVASRSLFFNGRLRGDRRLRTFNFVDTASSKIMDDEQEPQFLLRPLQLNDLPFIVALEQSSFPPNEAATPEKVAPFSGATLIVD